MDIKKILPIIGIIVLIYLIISIGAEKIINAISQVEILYIVLVFFLIIPRIILDTYKWQYICKKQKMNLDFVYLTKINLIGSFYGMITPGGIGSYIKIYYITKKSKSSLEKCISNILMNVTIETIALYFFATVGSMFLIKQFPVLFPPISILFIIYLSLFLLFMKKEKSKKLFYIFQKYLIPKRFKGKISKSFDLLYEDLPKLKDMLIPFLIAAFTWIWHFSQIYVVALAFSINVPYLYFIMIYAISAVIASMPVSIGGFGLRESALVIMLSIFGIAPASVFAMSIIGSLITNVLPSVVGAIISLTKVKRSTV